MGYRCRWLRWGRRTDGTRNRGVVDPEGRTRSLLHISHKMEDRWHTGISRWRAAAPTGWIFVIDSFGFFFFLFAFLHLPMFSINLHTRFVVISLCTSCWSQENSFHSLSPMYFFENCFFLFPLCYACLAHSWLGGTCDILFLFSILFCCKAGMNGTNNNFFPPLLS